MYESYRKRRCFTVQRPSTNTGPNFSRLFREAVPFQTPFTTHTPWFPRRFYILRSNFGIIYLPKRIFKILHSVVHVQNQKHYVAFRHVVYITCILLHVNTYVTFAQECVFTFIYGIFECTKIKCRCVYIYAPIRRRRGILRCTCRSVCWSVGRYVCR